MDEGTFSVRPVTRYEAARYPSMASPVLEDAPPESDRRCSPWAVLGIGLLIVGMSVGLLACFQGGDHSTDRPLFPNVPGGRFGPDGPDPSCTPGGVWCEDMGTVVFCDSDGLSSTAYDCSTYCAETAGPDYYSTGCDAEAADPCLCEYGIVDGEPPMCSPGEVYCEDQDTAMVCTDGYYYEALECDPYCKEQYGADAYAVGCDADAEDPCLCEYGIVDGDPPMCTPGDVYCADEDTAMICNDDYYYEAIECDAYCVEQYGSDAYAVGCDADEEDPCLCDYGPVDGMPVPS